MIMRSSYIIFLSILTTSLCLLFCLLCRSVFSSSNSPVPVSLLGRRAVRDLSMSSSSQQDAHHKIKVHEEMERDSNQPGSLSNEFANVYNEPELVYHTDYHGVTTHPNPTPKLSNEFANVYNEPELAYHTDYHGVTTHPNPTPKHPKP